MATDDCGGEITLEVRKNRLATFVFSRTPASSTPNHSTVTASQRQVWGPEKKHAGYSCILALPTSVHPMRETLATVHSIPTSIGPSESLNIRSGQWEKRVRNGTRQRGLEARKRGLHTGKRGFNMGEKRCTSHSAAHFSRFWTVITARPPILSVKPGLAVPMTASATGIAPQFVPSLTPIVHQLCSGSAPVLQVCAFR